MKVMVTLMLLVAFLSMGCVDSEKKKKTFKIGISQCMSDDDWRKYMNEEIFRELSFYPEYKIDILYRDANYNTGHQVQQIRELVGHNIDLLMVSPNEAEPITAIIDSVFEKGIPVVVVDREINSPNFTAYVGAENIDIGREAGKYAAELLQGRGKVVEITGLKSSTPAIERSVGFYDALKDYPEIEIIHSFEGKWLSSEVKMFSDSLQAYLLRSDLVFAHNDPMAEAVYELCHHQKYVPYILGVDGLSTPGGGVEMVLNKKIDATFLYPTGGDEAVQTAIKILENRYFPKYNYLRTFRIDRQNAETVSLQGKRILDQQRKIDKQRNLMGELSGLIDKKNTFLFLTFMVIVLLLGIAALIAFLLYQKNRVNSQLSRKNKTIQVQSQTIVKQNEDLVQMAKVAEEATEMKIRFFTNISHEFRTALSLISLPVKNLVDKLEGSPYKGELSTIWTNTERLLRLSDELLDFRKIDKNRYRLTFVRNDLSLFIKEFLFNFEQSAKAKQIQISTSLPNTLMADFDRNVIEKVLVNLITNAIKYSAENGAIHLEVKELDGTVLISVSDTGKGIPKDELPFIFDRFYRLKQNVGIPVGSGIGLALAKEMVQLHGGRINVDSVHGQGTRFTIKIPRYYHGVAEIEEQSGNVPDVKQMDALLENKDIKILVVEDNIELRNVLEQIINKYFTVITAGDGEAGARRAKLEHPDLIVSDILMPKMGGIEMCRQIKATFQTALIPVVLLTAIDSDESMIKGFDMGADAYLTKPFNELLLLTRISTLIKRYKILRERMGLASYMGHSNGIHKEGQLFVKRCLEVVNENIGSTNLTLDVLAEKMFVSRATLNRRIKEITGKRPVDFLKQAKLNFAAQLLLNSNYNVNEIAWRSGFYDTKYFSRQFYTEFNCLPSKFRQEFKNG